MSLNNRISFLENNLYHEKMNLCGLQHCPNYSIVEKSDRICMNLKVELRILKRRKIEINKIVNKLYKEIAEIKKELE